jgi:hypothetical protein
MEVAMGRQWIVAGGFASAACVAGAAACGGGDHPLGSVSTSDAGDDGDAVAPGDAANFGDGFAETGTQAGCSGDLRNVIDGAGNVLQTCAPDQGCLNGKCVPACMAASQSKGNLGCDYVVATPSFHDTSAPPCFTVFVSNHWPLPAHIGVTYAGQTYDVTKFGRIPDGTKNAAAWPLVAPTGLKPDEVAVLFLSGDPTSNNFGDPIYCPVAQAISTGTAVADTGRGSAFHITSDVPVTAYDILPFGGGTSYLPGAELILPTSAWGTNYVMALPPAPAGGEQWAQIVAAQNNTTVQIVPTTALPSGTGVAGAAANTVATYSLNAGEVIQWHAAAMASLELSGSVVQASQPVSVVGGAGYLCLGGGCDSAHQQTPPVSALGWHYVAAGHHRCPSSSPGGSELAPYRVVGAVDGTTLTFDPPLTDAPTQIDRGQVIDFDDNTIKQPYAKPAGAFTVTSQDAQHPFFLGEAMAGMLMLGPDPSCPGISVQKQGEWTLGDEEFVNLMPPEQFLSQYEFFNDPTYGTTNLVLVRQKTSSGFADVTVDCLGVVGGWTPVGGSTEYEQTNVDIYRATPVGSCVNGSHFAKSSGPFGLMVWGFDLFASYAYPAGGNAQVLNSVVVKPVPK